MTLIRKGTSALGKLLMIAVLAATFFAGMVGVVYLSLQGEELKVPEIVGKDFFESEEELEQLGLKIKKRADRYSKEKQNTILEQRPKAGEVVKTGQMILVVVSKEDPDGDEAPATIQTDDEDDIEKIGELISDAPARSSQKSSRREKKKTVKTRDVVVEKPEESEDEAPGTTEAAAAPADSADKTDKPAAPQVTRPAGDVPADVPTRPPVVEKPKPVKPPVPKPNADKGSGETRPRKTP